MSFSGFQLACAMAAWKTRQAFHKVYRLSLAKQSVDKWIKVAANWWKKTTNSDWSCKQGRLSNVLSQHETTFLKHHFGIISVDQLLMSNHQDILDKLCEANELGSNNALWEGMFASWIMRAQEKSSIRFTHERDSSLGCQFDMMKRHLSNKSTHQVERGYRQQSSAECNMLMRQQTMPNTTTGSPMRTPMQCLHYLFLRSHHITSDEKLSNIHVLSLTSKFISFLETNNCTIPFSEAHQIILKLKNDALNMGVNSTTAISATPHSNRIDKSPQNLSVMYTISSLSKIITPPSGLPIQTIYTFDDENNVLYQFRVNIEQSKVPNSGYGAFLTFEGCKVLKESSYWKRKVLSGKLVQVAILLVSKSIFSQ